MPITLAFGSVFRILKAMEAHEITLSAIATTPNSADLFTCAKGKWIVQSTKAQVYLDEKAVGQTKFPETSKVAGTSVPAENVQPSFYPVATAGAECAAIVTSLTWADKNLLEGYEWVGVVYTSGRATKYLVSGVLNSTQTLSNDPFGTQGASDGFVEGACWKGLYSPGQNPYA